MQGKVAARGRRMVNIVDPHIKVSFVIIFVTQHKGSELEASISMKKLKNLGIT